MKLLFSASSDPAFNLAAEEYLFLQKDEEWIFLYANQSSVIIGSNQAIENEVNLSFCEDENIDVVRRLSGGGAVYHDEGNLNYCFISTKTENPMSGSFLQPIIIALQVMNIPAEQGKRKDLWLKGFKISGTASHISKEREMHHGTLLYDVDIEKLHKALSPTSRNETIKASRSVVSPVRNISDYLKENERTVFSANEFFYRFRQKIMELFQLTEISALSSEDIHQIEELKAQKYAKKEWIYKM